MLKPFPKTNIGLEVQAILSSSHILILDGNAWGIQNDALWETCLLLSQLNSKSIVRLENFCYYQPTVIDSLKCMQFCLLKSSTV